MGRGNRLVGGRWAGFSAQTAAERFVPDPSRRVASVNVCCGRSRVAAVADSAEVLVDSGEPHSSVDPMDLAGYLGAAKELLADAADLLLRLPDCPLGLTELRRGITETSTSLEEALEAANRLALGVPVARSFPDGDPAPEHPTPRQLLYLSDLAAQQGQGRSAERRCTATRVDGQACHGTPLRGLEVCYAHASPEQREAHRRRRRQRPE